MNNRTRLTLAIGGSLVCVLVVSPLCIAATTVIKALEFNGNTLPSAESDIALFNNTGRPEAELYSVDSGVLRQRMKDATGNASYAFPNSGTSGGNLNPALGTTIDARLRVTNIESAPGGFGAVFQAFDGVNRYGALFTPIGIDMPSSSGVASIEFNHSDWHNYRLHSPANSNQVELYIDNTLRLTTTAQSDPMHNGFDWGDGFSLPGNGANVDWDYVRVYQGDSPPFEPPAPVGNIIFRDDFEAANGDAVGSAPNVGGTNIGASWSIKNEAPGVIDIANASVGSEFPAPRPGSGDQYLRLYRPASVGSSSDGLFEFTSPISSGKFQVNYSLYNKTPIGSSRGSQIVLGAGSSDSIPPSTGPINLLFRPDGGVGLFDQSLNDVREILPVGSYALDSWQDVAVTVDIDRQSFDLAIGSARIDAVPFPISHSNFSHGLIAPAHNSVSFVDDILITTAAEQPPVQNVYLAFGARVPFNTGVIHILDHDVTVLFGASLVDNSMRPDESIDPTSAAAIAKNVQDIFRNSGITRVNVEFGQTPPEGATVVYFTDVHQEAPVSLIPFAETVPVYGEAGVIDRFNEDGPSEIVIFSQNVRDDTRNGTFEVNIARTIAHELGHSFGLMHIDSDPFPPPVLGDAPIFGVMGNFKDIPAAALPNQTIPDIRFFYESPLEVTDRGSVGITHNPLYHLFESVEGLTPAEIDTRSIQSLNGDIFEVGDAGTWDRRDKQFVNLGRFVFPSPDIDLIIYDAIVLMSFDSESSGGILLREIAGYDQIKLSELATLEVEGIPGAVFAVFGSSIAGGDPDIVMSPNGAAESEIFFSLIQGTTDVALVQQTAGGPIVLARGAVVISTVPEPTTAHALIVALLALGSASRYACRGAEAKRHEGQRCYK